MPKKTQKKPALPKLTSDQLGDIYEKLQESCSTEGLAEALWSAVAEVHEIIDEMPVAESQKKKWYKAINLAAQIDNKAWKATHNEIRDRLSALIDAAEDTEADVREAVEAGKESPAWQPAPVVALPWHTRAYNSALEFMESCRDWWDSPKTK